MCGNQTQSHIAKCFGPLQALQLRCERFMCDNFHKILDDPLLQVGQIDSACSEQRQLGMNGTINFLPLTLCRV